MSRGEGSCFSPQDEKDTNGARRLAEHRRVNRRPDRSAKRADWQAGGQTSRRAILMLISARRLLASDAMRRQRATLQSAVSIWALVGARGDVLGWGGG